MWQKEAKCFQEVSPRCEGLQTHLNPTGLLLIAFDVHVNMTCFNIPAQNIPSSEDGAKGRGLRSGLEGVASPHSNWRPVFSALSVPSSELPPPPYVFQLPFSRPPFFPFPLMYRHSYLACGRVCLDMVMCVSWHIIARHFSETMKGNREEPVPLDLQWVAPDHASLSGFCPC